MLAKDSTLDQTLAVFAECPDCSALVLSYARSRLCPSMQGHEELRALTCDRCGAVFDVAGDEFLLRSIQASWLVSPDLAN